MPNSLITLFSISICSIGILNSVDVSQATATPLNKSTIKEYIDTNNLLYTLPFKQNTE